MPDTDPPSESLDLVALTAAIAANPTNALAYNDRGNAYRTLKRPAEALEDYRRCIHLAPGDLKLRFNLALALLDLNRPAEALPWAQQAASVDPPYWPAWICVGEALVRLGEAQQAIAWFDQVLAANPDDVQARLGRAVAQLSLGQFREGWIGFEVRLQDQRVGQWRPDTQHPPWRGEVDPRGLTLLLTAEQGLGDTIMMARYLAPLRARGAHVILQVQAPLLDLCLDLADDVQVLGDPPPDYDMHTPLMSLPRAFRTELDSIPATVPYLHVDATHRARWQHHLGPASRPRIGLAWSGNPLHPLDGLRSTSLATLAPLLHRLDADFHILHDPVRPTEQPDLAHYPNLHHHPGRSFTDTAALVRAMDLVISVDTSLAHLAGALARPVWLLLPAATTDFRWLHGRTDSPWYPTMRIFRQPRLGDWAGMVEDVITAWQQGPPGERPT